MHVVVILSGVADPRRPLIRPPSDNWCDIVGTPTTPFKLSPFDEAALEVALKLRDKNPEVLVTTLLTDGASDIALVRTVAAYQPDHMHGLCPPAEHRGNPCWYQQHVLDVLASASAQAAETEKGRVDLWLMGREHGDLDDGAMAPYLAESWDVPFIGLALSVARSHDNAWVINRAISDRLETIRISGPLLASISNDRGNRLRHPLMKNVMLAKQKKILTSPASIAADKIPSLAIAAMQPLDASRKGETPCRKLEGTVQEQVQALVQYLQGMRPSGSPHAEH